MFFDQELDDIGRMFGEAIATAGFEGRGFRESTHNVFPEFTAGDMYMKFSFQVRAYILQVYCPLQ
jgi:hypothetical protein